VAAHAGPTPAQRARDLARRVPIGAQGPGVVMSEDAALGGGSPKAEAAALVTMVRSGAETVTSARALIGIPAQTRRVFLSFVQRYPIDAAMIHHAIAFRAATRREFEAILRAQPDRSPA
jgi:hypothetical protein